MSVVVFILQCITRTIRLLFPFCVDENTYYAGGLLLSWEDLHSRLLCKYIWRRRGGWTRRVRMRAYLPKCTLQSVWKGRGEGGGSVRCWIAYLRFQSPPFARTLSPLRGPAMDVTPGCAFFIIFLHFQHADTLYIANSIGTWRCFYCQFWSRLLYAGDTDLFGCSALRSSNSVSLFHQLVLLYKWFEWVFRVKWFIVSNVFHWIWMSGGFHASNLKDL